MIENDQFNLIAAPHQRAIVWPMPLNERHTWSPGAVHHHRPGLVIAGTPKSELDYSIVISPLGAVIYFSLLSPSANENGGHYSKWRCSL